MVRAPLDLDAPADLIALGRSPLDDPDRVRRPATGRARRPGRLHAVSVGCPRAVEAVDRSDVRRRPHRRRTRAHQLRGARARRAEPRHAARGPPLRRHARRHALPPDPLRHPGRGRGDVDDRRGRARSNGRSRSRSRTSVRVPPSRCPVTMECAGQRPRPPRSAPAQPAVARRGDRHGHVDGHAARPDPGGSRARPDGDRGRVPRCRPRHAGRAWSRTTSGACRSPMRCATTCSWRTS